MKKLKIVFTDSGLGGLPIMAKFVKLAKQKKLAVETVFFNAQYSRELGYKKMPAPQQIAVFDSVLDAIQKNYNPDIIAIACNTLSVVYYQTEFYKTNKARVLDIIAIGQEMIEKAQTGTIIEVAMLTTISSAIYENKTKNRIAIASDVMLPDAIENAYQEKINQFLKNIFESAKSEIKKDTSSRDLSLFLGCTHFPIIKEQFLRIALENDLNIKEVLDPNEVFTHKVYLEALKLNRPSFKNKQTAEVISRMPFQEAEITNIAKLVEEESKETAEALINYTLKKGLF